MEAGEDDFADLFRSKLDEGDVASSAAMEAAALALYAVINHMIMAKASRGELSTMESANAFGNSITRAFASACEAAGEEDFLAVLRTKLDPLGLNNRM